MADRNPDENYTRQVECDYKSHRYSVRDNGAIMRHGDGLFPELGDEWTFGTFNSRGILQFKSVSVPKVVATAFHGPAPDDFYVAFHIDGNVENNRPENLRWLSPIEQVLDNPETVSAIMKRFGSIDAFLMRPSNLLLEGGQYLRFRTITGGEVLDAIKHLVSMSSEGPLRTGNVYVDWLNARKENETSSESIQGDGELITMDDAFLSAWSDLIKNYSDQYRFARQLDQCRKELRHDADGVFALTLYVGNDMQANWIRDKKLPEMEAFLTSELGARIHLQVETEKH
jgi:hypothetical protein